MRKGKGAFAWLAVVPMLLAPALAAAQEGDDRAQSRNMALVGENDLQGRSAYQPVIQEQNGRWIAYIGHHGGTDAAAKPRNPLTGAAEDNGTSIVDVTDPHNPKYLHHVPGEPGKYEGGGAQMVRVCDGKTLPKADKSKTYLLRTFGNAAHEIYDVTDPAKPVLLTRIVEGLRGTHKSWWECDTGIAYLVSGDPAWRTNRMTKIYDLSDPAHPVFIRDFGLVGQQPGATGEAPPALHGPFSTGPDGNRVYFNYGTGSEGMLQIVDRKKLLEGPRDPTPENLTAPEISRMYLPKTEGIHTTYPLIGVELPEYAKDEGPHKFDFLVMPGEEFKNECQQPRQLVWIADITDEKHPAGAATWSVSERSGHFCDRGGRFGPHSSNENLSPIYYKRIIFFSYFNAGVRALDVRDPFHPREVGFYIPAVSKATDQRCIEIDGKQRCKTAIQTNNVEVDDRGYIYIVDRANTGMHILELTGPARQIANFQRP
jgi:hypothetical protein